MLYCDRTDVSGGIDINKTSELKECDICQYSYFLNKGFKFQSKVCNSCHYLLIMSMNLSGIAILNIKGSNYRCIEATNLMRNVDLTEKVEHYKTL